MIGQEAFEDLVSAGRPVEGEALGHIDFSDLPDGRVVLRDCSLAGASLADAQCEGALFENCEFSGASFRSAMLAQSKFRHCNFFDADARLGADFHGASLVGASFEHCNLALARFTRASAYDLGFSNCKAAGADFEEADFSRKTGRQIVCAGRFHECMLDMASFARVRLEKCVFAETSLRQADFSSAELQGADFRNANLDGANFSGAALDDADLRGAGVVGVNLARCRSFSGIKVGESQVTQLVGPLGMRVFPD